jgi:chorismate synthase
VPAASVVGEAMVALELARAFLEKFGGDSLADVEAAWRDWRVRVEEV